MVIDVIIEWNQFVFFWRFIGNS